MVHVLRTFLLNTSLSVYGIISQYGARIAVSMMLVSYWVGYTVFYYTEPADSALRSFGDYSWFFIVTSSTVGYGDISPATGLGKIAGSFIILSGVSAFGIMVGWVTSLAAKLSEKIRKGLMNWDMKNHIVIIGYHPERTQNIVNQILGDEKRTDRKIMLCYNAHQADENPMIGVCEAVKGTLDSDDVMERANIAKADKVIIDIGDDDRALAIALAVVANTPSNAHIVVGLNDMLNGPSKLSRVGREREIECALWADYKLLVQAMQDPGIAHLLNILTCNHRGAEFYRTDLPESLSHEVTFGDVFVAMKKKYNATVIGIINRATGIISENPEWDWTLSSGTAIYYVAKDRVTDICPSTFEKAA